MRERLEKWTPRELCAVWQHERVWLGEKERALLLRLATRLDMRRFWEWLDQKNDELASQGLELTPDAVFWVAVRGAEDLDKPSNLTPKKRAKYLQDVRLHADALVKLLKNTRFDLRLHQWHEKLGYERSELARFSIYPECTLTEQLQDLIKWAEMPDYHGTAGRPTWMIRQGGESARRHYLAAHLVREFNHSLHLLPPLELLAILLTAVLDADPQITADATQKMIHRIKERESDLSEDDIGGRSISLEEISLIQFLKNHD